MRKKVRLQLNSRIISILDAHAVLSIKGGTDSHKCIQEPTITPPAGGSGGNTDTSPGGSGDANYSREGGYQPDNDTRDCFLDQGCY